MKYFNSTFLNHIYHYIYENVSCLLYTVEVLPEQTMYFTAYFSLLKDIAEAYGSWTALSIFIMSTVLTMVAVEQLVVYGLSYFKLSGSTTKNQQTNKLVADKHFTSFNFFKFLKN